MCMSVCYHSSWHLFRLATHVFLLDFDMWIFEKHGVKCKYVRAHCEPFSHTIRINEGQQLPVGELVCRICVCGHLLFKCMV